MVKYSIHYMAKMTMFMQLYKVYVRLQFVVDNSVRQPHFLLWLIVSVYAILNSGATNKAQHTSIKGYTAASLVPLSRFTH